MRKIAPCRCRRCPECRRRPPRYQPEAAPPVRLDWEQAAYLRLYED
jgi:hypothetical protein